MIGCVNNELSIDMKRGNKKVEEGIAEADFLSLKQSQMEAPNNLFPRVKGSNRLALGYSGLNKQIEKP